MLPANASWRSPILVLSILALCTTACGKSQQEEQAEEAARKMEEAARQVEQGAQRMAEGAAGSEQMAQGLQQMTQGFQQMAQSSTQAVDYEQLKALLPELDGWTRTDVRGEQINMPMAISRAEARYRRDESHIDLEIMDTALSQLLLAPMSMFLAAGYSERSDDGYKRAAKIGGQPGMEDWNVNSQRGEVTAVVANRFIVQATGHDVSSLDPVRQMVEAVDLARLGGIK